MAEETQEPKSREEIVAWYKDQIELASLRTELAELHSRAVKAEAERIQASMFIAQVQAATEEAKKDDPSEKPNGPSLTRVE